MMVSTNGRNVSLLVGCLFLGGLAEVSFFHTSVGLSCIIFLGGFYGVFFLRFKSYPFKQRRMGILLMMIIWILGANYFLLDNELLQYLNSLILPLLIFTQLVLVTKPKELVWHTPLFLVWLVNTLIHVFTYNKAFSKAMYDKVFKDMDEDKYTLLKKVATGFLLGAPLLFVVVLLLMQADRAFQNMLSQIPLWFLGLELNQIIVRVFIVIGLGLLFYGFFQVLSGNRQLKEKSGKESSRSFDGIVSLTILTLLNIVYAMFIFVQFTYFFGGELQGNLSFAEYARRGFFELLAVTIVNLSVLLPMLVFNKAKSKAVDLLLRIMYSLLILFSSILLASAFQRLQLYEAHYGYTVGRVLPHLFMIFLLVLFIYTFINVWVRRLPLIHFYVICGLLFYMGLNVVNIEGWVVERNLERYEETGKVDIDYLNSLSYTGVDGLLDLYEKDPEIPRLSYVLKERQREWLRAEDKSWQSFNMQKHRVRERLEGWRE